MKTRHWVLLTLLICQFFSAYARHGNRGGATGVLLNKNVLGHEYQNKIITVEELEFIERYGIEVYKELEQKHRRNKDFTDRFLSFISSDDEAFLGHFRMGFDRRTRSNITEARAKTLLNHMASIITQIVEVNGTIDQWEKKSEVAIISDFKATISPFIPEPLQSSFETKIEIDSILERDYGVIKVDVSEFGTLIPLASYNNANVGKIVVSNSRSQIGDEQFSVLNEAINLDLQVSPLTRKITQLHEALYIFGSVYFGHMDTRPTRELIQAFLLRSLKRSQLKSLEQSGLRSWTSRRENLVRKLVDFVGVDIDIINASRAKQFSINETSSTTITSFARYNGIFSLREEENSACIQGKLNVYLDGITHIYLKEIPSDTDSESLYTNTIRTKLVQTPDPVGVAPGEVFRVRLFKDSNPSVVNGNADIEIFRTETDRFIQIYVNGIRCVYKQIGRSDNGDSIAPSQMRSLAKVFNILLAE